jgi:hypothetical protein
LNVGLLRSSMTLLRPHAGRRPVGSVHQGPSNRKNNEAEVARADLVRALRRVVEAEVGPASLFFVREDLALSASNEALRCYFKETLQQMSDGYADELLIDGVLHRRCHDKGKVVYHSQCGSFPVWRATYRPVGKRNAKTVVPLELEAGLVEYATPSLAKSIAVDLGDMDSRRYVLSQTESSHRVPPSRSTVERIGHAIGQEAKTAATKIEPHLRRREKVPDEAVAISVGLDRTTVPYEEEREEGAPPKTRRKKRTKPYVRKAPPPVDVNYKMDYVGTVTLVDEHGEKLVSRKYFATHEDGPEGILKRMMADVRSALSQRPAFKVGVVQDGAHEMWNLVRSALKEELGIEAPLEGIDRYHLFERLGDIVTLTEDDEAKREQRLVQWDKALDADDGAIEQIELYIFYRLWAYAGKARETLQDTLTYIRNNKDRMRYVTLREAGLPLGSGVTEGACKSLASRAKRSGQRWHNRGVSSVLELRAIQQSDRLPKFWRLLHRRYTALVESADGVMERAA